MINSVSGSGAVTDTTGSSVPTAKSDVSKDAFLQLLVAQVKNQDPLQPTDGVQFLTQLAQFTQLEQTIGMRSDLEAIKTVLTPAGSTGAGAGPGQSTNSQPNTGASNV